MSSFVSLPSENLLTIHAFLQNRRKDNLFYYVKDDKSIVGKKIGVKRSPFLKERRILMRKRNSGLFETQI